MYSRRNNRFTHLSLLVFLQITNMLIQQVIYICSSNSDQESTRTNEMYLGMPSDYLSQLSPYQELLLVI
jgi:hypothetical protein